MTTRLHIVDASRISTPFDTGVLDENDEPVVVFAQRGYRVVLSNGFTVSVCWRRGKESTVSIRDEGGVVYAPHSYSQFQRDYGHCRALVDAVEAGAVVAGR